jgi:hypothetical protein
MEQAKMNQRFEKVEGLQAFSPQPTEEKIK